MARTKHLRPDGTPQFTNSLSNQTSPYLLQHAHNPVNWHPWSDQAFEKAKDEKKPVLLSIGYSTCHWCHVMEEESFEDLEIAQFLNENYIAIKVDREERPDLDAVYMASVQSLTGRGGWPMSVWLTPDRKPFYAGTYFPPRDGDRGSGIGFLTMLKRLKEIYQSEPEQVATQVDQIVEAVQNATSLISGEKIPPKKVLDEVFDSFTSQFDSAQAGFGPAPKFPRPATLRFLLHYYYQTQAEGALQMVVKTLKAMSKGGIYDQLGGGFHRYSVDRYWLVPHFEKMLYDNAQLVLSYLDAYQITGEESFAQTARETLDYILREMTDAEGGFHCATDADSEGEEGTFFVWTYDEIVKALPGKEGEWVAQYFGVTKEGNFEGKNVLNIPVPLSIFAKKIGKDETTFNGILTQAKKKLLDLRSKRIPPLKDDKILTSWNGLMIAALSKGGFVLNEPRYIAQAKKGVEFIEKGLFKNKILLRSYRKGKAQVSAYADDYAFLIFGLLNLFEVEGSASYLSWAIELQKKQDDLFWDSSSGGYFMTSEHHEKLFAREKAFYDGAEPSPTSVSAGNLLKLYSLTLNSKYKEKVQKIFEVFSSVLERGPSVSPWLSSVLSSYYSKSAEIYLTQKAPEWLQTLRKAYLPNAVFVIGPTQELLKSIPWLEGKEGPTPKAYVCEEGSCQTPAQTVEQFATQISSVRI